jgi:hypothetical protein
MSRVKLDNNPTHTLKPLFLPNAYLTLGLICWRISRGLPFLETLLFHFNWKRLLQYLEGLNLISTPYPAVVEYVLLNFIVTGKRDSWQRPLLEE